MTTASHRRLLVRWVVALAALALLAAAGTAWAQPPIRDIARATVIAVLETVVE